MDTAREARFWHPLEGEGGEGADPVRCQLCSHRCRIPAGSRGLCGVRENRGGTLFTLVYGRLVAENVDPIEKKPLFHMAPGSLSYSVATAGCNLRCRHCQNHQISQLRERREHLPGHAATPAQVVDTARRKGCRSIAYTYTEPTVFLEFALDCMRLAHRAGLRNVFVSNGYLSPEAIAAAAPYLDAANIDVKAFDEAFYREVCGCHLQPVLDCVRELWLRGVWLEATTLVIPGRNDGEQELREIARFLGSVSPDLPWHVTGFYPTYKMTDAPPTPVETLAGARRIGVEEGLRYVYAGNRPGAGGEDTRCPGCGAVAIGRRGFRITTTAVNADGTCAACGTRLAGLEMGGES